MQWMGAVKPGTAIRSELLAATAALVLLLPVAVSAAEGDEPFDPEVAAEIAKANAACFDCHSPAAVAKQPAAGLDLCTLRFSTVAPDRFHASNHGEQKCVDCHGGEDDEGKQTVYYDEFPHDPKGKEATAECSDCHAAKVKRIRPMFLKSVHAKADDLREKFTCATCHDPHVHAVAKKLVDPRAVVAMDNQICFDCHDSDERFAEFAPRDAESGQLRTRPKIDHIHEWLPNARLHWTAVRCIDCHTPEVEPTKLLSHEILDEEHAERNCVACHSRDTMLNLRLYRHLASEEQQWLGFTNSVMLRSSYVVGATQSPFLDLLLGLASVAALLGCIGHGLARYIAKRRPKVP